MLNIKGGFARDFGYYLALGRKSKNKTRPRLRAVRSGYQTTDITPAHLNKERRSPNFPIRPAYSTATVPPAPPARWTGGCSRNRWPASARRPPPPSASLVVPSTRHRQPWRTAPLHPTENGKIKHLHHQNQHHADNQHHSRDHWQLAHGFPPFPVIVSAGSPCRWPEYP